MADPVFDEAKAICLKNCFEILIDNLALKEPEAQVRFQRCCTRCRKAHKLATTIGMRDVPIDEELP